MELIIAIITIWLGLVGEGFLDAAFGGSLVAVLAIFLIDRWDRKQFIIVFGVIALALDLIRFLPVGSTFILITMMLLAFKLMQKGFQRWTLVGSVVTLFFSFILWNVLLKVILQVVENSTAVGALNWKLLLLSSGSALIMIITYYLLELLLGLFSKPNAGTIKLK